MRNLRDCWFVQYHWRGVAVILHSAVTFGNLLMLQSELNFLSFNLEDSSVCIVLFRALE